MEYCPEIAVLQSAFQLVSKKAGQALSDLPKEKCTDYVKIISTSVEEICTGLEHDLDPDEKLIWQEKLHLVLLYALVKKKYKDNETSQLSEEKVPVCGVLDTITAILPTYSSSFYFELLKLNDWTGMFLQSLQCLDYETASLLFEDLLFHCHSNPVTIKDEKVIAVVKDKLLSRCLCVPDNPSELCVKLLEPLTQSRIFIQTLYPEETVFYDKKSVTMEIKNRSKLNVQCDMNTNSSRVGISFFDVYVEKNPKILDTVMDHFESVLENFTEGPIGIQSQELLETVSQLGIWNYLDGLEVDSELSDKWFIDNVLVPERSLEPDGVETIDLVYSLNFTLLQSIHKGFPGRRVHLCLQKAVSLILDLLNKGNCSGESEKGLSVQMVKQNVQVVAGLTVNFTVLLRMLAGLYTKADISESMVQMSGVSETVAAEIVDILEKIQGKVAEAEDVEEEIVLSKTWSEDVTLEALLKRIDQKLPQYQVCVDRLIGDGSMRFWTLGRLYSVMNRHSTLLSCVDRVLRLTNILDNLKGGNCDQKEQSLMGLITDAFSELSFPDQDMVVMEIYCSGHSSIPAFFREGLTRKVTNVFNKVTADLDNQVLSEVTLLCLGDPVLVLRTAVSLCVRNEQQAVNCALVIQHLGKTSTSRHPVHHPGISLVALLVQDFLTSQPLSEKEQKCFCIFVSHLMKPSINSASKSPVLLATEFLHTSVLPFVSVDNLFSTNTVSCNFAATLLLLAFEAGCYKNCDWSEYEFEPMALVLSLVEIKHECVVLWEMKNQLNDEENEEEDTTRVAMETNSSKLALKETVNECLDKLCQMVQDDFLSIQQNDVRWLLEVTSDLHWTVKFGLCPFFSACSFHQYTNEWLSTLDSLLADLNSSLVPILQFVAVERTLVPRILDNIPMDTQIESNELIVALIQVLPQCLRSEFESIVSFLEGLQTTETVHVSLVYRLRSTFNLPLLDYSEVRPALYTSQLLGDMIISLATTLTSQGERLSVVPHVVQCYINVMKTRCDQIIQRKDLQLFYLGELFHHVCEVTLNLPADVMDSTLVFLLHTLNKFKDIVKAKAKGHKKVDVSASMSKMIKNIENGMMSAVQGLPDDCEEKLMILKKLQDHS